MTCIAAVEFDGGVMMGADSAATSGDFSFVSSTMDKVWTDGEFIFGACGNWRMLQLLRYALTVPQLPADTEDLDKFLVMDFMDAVRSVLLESGIVQTKNSIESLHGAEFLVGVRGRVYYVQEDFSILRSALGYAATGCGYDLALGSLYSTQKLKPKTRITRALEAASTHSSAVAPPFTILEQKCPS